MRRYCLAEAGDSCRWLSCFRGIECRRRSLQRLEHVRISVVTCIGKAPTLRGAQRAGLLIGNPARRPNRRPSGVWISIGFLSLLVGLDVFGRRLAKNRWPGPKPDLVAGSPDWLVGSSINAQGRCSYQGVTRWPWLEAAALGAPILCQVTFLHCQFACVQSAVAIKVSFSV